MLLDHESQLQIDKNKGQPKEKQVFSIIGAEAYCRIQELKESHPEMVASAELRYDSIYKKNSSVVATEESARYTVDVLIE